MPQPRHTSLRSIFNITSNWIYRNFSDPDAIALLFTLVIGFILFKCFSQFLLPIITSVIIAYLLRSPVQYLRKWHVPNTLAVTIVYLSFLGLLILVLFFLLPILWKQLTALMHELPLALRKGEIWTTTIINRYPKLFPNHYDPFIQVGTYLQKQSAHIGKLILSLSLATIPSLIQSILYLVLIPLLVFFFLKDGSAITQWISRYLPKRQGLMRNISHQIHQQIGAYVRGRVLEIIIVTIIASIAFNCLGLRYAFLLGFALGISVIIPYVGALMVIIPFTIIGLMQWGLSAHFAYAMLTLGIIITFDGNLIVPLLFSEAMALHPVVIILSVLIFGGLWGFWGVFFAIPLATALKTILYAWPQVHTTVNRSMPDQASTYHHDPVSEDDIL